MNDVAIRANELSKRFMLRTEKRTSLKERIIRGRSPKAREFWALRDASFEVGRGQTFGIVGHNGSGKSTALKVLTGVYRPTSGSVEVHGRVSALLELGAGFHPELTGRENIRLNGSILGMAPRRIEAMMDEIIDFSGIEEFIDSPVKVYSSGMYVRLGFAISVKLEPEILIVDEIIAVGDEEFQRKCHDYLFKLRREGTTIVVVSHSMGVIESMCDNAVWLDHGLVRAIGPARDTVQQYMDAVDAAEIEARSEAPAIGAGHPAAGVGSGEIRVTGVEFLDGGGEPAQVLSARRPATVRIHFRAWEDLPQVTFGVTFHEASGTAVAGRTSATDFEAAVPCGEGFVEMHVPDLLLNSGTFLMTTQIGSHSRVYDVRDKAFGLTVRGSDSSYGGAVIMPCEWFPPKQTG